MYNYKFDEKIRKGMLKNGKLKNYELYKDSILHVSHERVFFLVDESGDLTGDGKLYLVEGCDEHFGIQLTPKICEDLALFFRDLSHDLKGEEEDGI